jgi:hypothetical protein
MIGWRWIYITTVPPRGHPKYICMPIWMPVRLSFWGSNYSVIHIYNRCISYCNSRKLQQSNPFANADPYEWTSLPLCSPRLPRLMPTRPSRATDRGVLVGGGRQQPRQADGSLGGQVNGDCGRSDGDLGEWTATLGGQTMTSASRRQPRRAYGDLGGWMNDDLSGQQMSW